MKKIKYIIILFLTLLNCTSQQPKQFTEAALNNTFIHLDGNSITFKDILRNHQGQTIVVDIWASWCSDCIKGMPKVKALQKQFPNVAYVFLSLDRGEKAWKRGIKKYNVNGNHYYFPNGKDCNFADFVNISWIPRYMVVNKAGEIVVFDVIEADDEKLIEAIKK